MDWEATRADFPTLSRRTHLNTCSLGALSTQSREAVVTFLDLWEEMGASAWYRIWLGECQQLRERVARLIGARSDEVALLPNVSSALAAISSNDAPGGNIVSAQMDFPTIPYAWIRRAQMRYAQSPDGIQTPLSAFEELVDDQTRWLATSHVYYSSGAIQDSKSLARLAHARGARFLLDAYQATGQLPTNVKEIGCDAYVTGGLKWLLGGPGIAFLYVKRELHDELSPQIAGWFGNEEQFAFDATKFTPRADARRFEAGTPAVASVYAANAGAGIIEKLGPERIRARTSLLVRELFERLQDAGFDLATPEDEDERAGIVMVRVADPPRVVKALAEERIIVDYRPGRVRVSPYFYNTSGEVEAFVEALKTKAKA